MYIFIQYLYIYIYTVHTLNPQSYISAVYGSSTWFLPSGCTCPGGTSISSTSARVFVSSTRTMAPWEFVQKPEPRLGKSLTFRDLSEWVGKNSNPWFGVEHESAEWMQPRENRKVMRNHRISWFHVAIVTDHRTWLHGTSQLGKAGWPISLFCSSFSLKVLVSDLISQIWDDPSRHDMLRWLCLIFYIDSYPKQIQ